MLKATWKKYELIFKQASGTSRGVLKEKTSYFITIWNEDYPEVKGIGECGLLRGLSYDDRPDYEEKLEDICTTINKHENHLLFGLNDWPSIYFGLEMALRDLETGGKRQLFQNHFLAGQEAITINGLIWMGDEAFMLQQIEDKLNKGFSCIKMKIGAIDFDQEMRLLSSIRQSYDKNTIELRVDANGAFSPEDVKEKLSRLAEMDIHSIEQPIKPKQINLMAELCRDNIVPIALDEELIGVTSIKEKRQVLEAIKPPYIILKPSLLGGFKGTLEWINLAEMLGIQWWVTSALESNIGLNAIAQWTYGFNNPLPQGLGTGGLYTNNFPSPLYLSEDQLFHSPSKSWQVNELV